MHTTPILILKIPISVVIDGWVLNDAARSDKTIFPRYTIMALLPDTFKSRLIGHTLGVSRAV